MFKLNITPSSATASAKANEITTASNIESGGGASGRATAICLGRPGLSPRGDIGFFQFRIAVHPFSLDVGLF